MQMNLVAQAGLHYLPMKLTPGSNTYFRNSEEFALFSLGTQWLPPPAALDAESPGAPSEFIWQTDTSHTYSASPSALISLSRREELHYSTFGFQNLPLVLSLNVILYAENLHVFGLWLCQARSLSHFFGHSRFSAYSMIISLLKTFICLFAHGHYRLSVLPCEKLACRLRVLL
jgi:hypothetical protein